MNLIRTIDTILQKEYNTDTHVELTSDNMKNPQVIYNIMNHTFYLTHNINEGKIYFSKWGYDDLMIIDRIISIIILKHIENDTFKYICNEIIEELINTENYRLWTK